MNKIVIIILALLLFYPSGGLTQDNIYGDYLISGLEKKVSLELEGAALVDVLKLLSQQIGLNFVSTEAVRSRMLTLYMEGVPLKEAMDIIFKANNLAYDYFPEANIYVVKEMGKPGLELKTKVYPLKYVRVKSSRLQGEITAAMAQEQEQTQQETEGAGEGANGIVPAVRQVLSEAGKIAEDPVTNSLIVVDVPAQFPIIDEVINKLDVAAPKVMIEIEMLDVSKTHLDKLGFNYANGLYLKFGGGARSTVFPFGEDWLKPKGSATSIANRITDAGGTDGAGLTPPVLGLLDLTSFTSVMQFLTEDTTTKFIARPKILTLSNETAEVNLTVNEAIGLSTTTAGQTGATSENVDREETGTKLRVTPQVNAHTREITLFVDMSNRESSNSGLTITGLTGDVKNVEKRGTKNIIRLKDGETLYIGGLIRRETSETNRKIPVLGDIPLLGALFRYRERPASDNVDRELLVFLTPRIVGDRLSTAARTAGLSREQRQSTKIDSVKLALDSLSQ